MSWTFHKCPLVFGWMACLDASFGFGWVIVWLTDDFYNRYFLEDIRNTKDGSV